MPLNIYLGTYSYLVDTCPRKSRVRLLFTVASDRDAAQAIFRRFICRCLDYRELLGIENGLVLEPLPPPKRYTADEARSFVILLLRYHFEYVDPAGEATRSVPDRVAKLVASHTRR
ncbi:MAG TPA: hypothetical protein VJ553_04790 [Candidatus Paceibacterota bacterium]|nr:hypothetical protein [Candidatus Paceibacterota bacterium]